MTSRTMPSTTEGTNRGPFTPTDWGLLLSSATIFGASFLFMAIGLEAFPPAVVTFGCLALCFFPASHRSIDPQDWPRLLAVSVTWMALPFSLFPIAQQYVNSAVAGMLNGATPLTTALFAAILLQRSPGPRQLLGLATGFLGILLIGIPSVGSGPSSALGVGLIVGAVCCYGVAINLAIPLQQKYGSLPIIWKSLAVALIFTAPAMLIGLPDSSFEPAPIAALLVLGVFGTGLASVAAASLGGRVGATRASVLTYVATPVAIVLGVAFRGDQLSVLELCGAALTLSGAWFASRSDP